MERPVWKPAVVVGIDFGMTCTGVAYSSEDSGWARPEVIQKWPDRETKLFNKFPTRIAYDVDGQPVDWGRCNTSTNIKTYEREFKLFLDSSFRDPSGDSPSHTEAVKYYTDYMTLLYNHVDSTLKTRIPRWHERDVEYRFSIPTTWKNPRLTDQLKHWLSSAGFTNTPNRRVIFSQTEAEAAAVYAAKQYQRGDVVMVVDAGGATTDINILEVTEKSADITRMLALDKAEGINVGSVKIDTGARTIIERKLKALHVYADTELKWQAEDMMQDHGFEYFKCNYDGKDDLLNIYMEVPGRPGQHLILLSTELRQIFDSLINELIISISDKITALAISHPDKYLKYIVLSGGLGSSPYVNQRLQDQFRHGLGRPENASRVDVVVVAEPQLAVVKGLVMDRSQTIHHGLSVYTGRCCRVSYGVLCRLPYDKKKHFGETVVKDPLTGDLMVEDQIDWLITEGQLVPEEGIEKPYSLKLSKDKRFEVFKAHIVMSEAPTSHLPRSTLHGEVTRLCTVKGTFLPSDYSTGQFENIKGVFSKKKEHDITRFNLRVNVGTDLSFEFVSPEGRSYSETTPRVRVQWEEVKPTPAGPRHRNSTTSFATTSASTIRDDATEVSALRAHITSTYSTSTPLPSASTFGDSQTTLQTMELPRYQSVAASELSKAPIQDFIDQLLELFKVALGAVSCHECATSRTTASLRHSLSLLYMWSQGIELDGIATKLHYDPDLTSTIAELLSTVAELLCRIGRVLISELFKVDRYKYEVEIEAFAARYGQYGGTTSADSDYNSDSDPDPIPPRKSSASKKTAAPDGTSVHATHQRQIRQLESSVASLLSLSPTLTHVARCAELTGSGYSDIKKKAVLVFDGRRKPSFEDRKLDKKIASTPQTQQTKDSLYFRNH